MNYIMAGMIPVMVIWGTHDPFSHNPESIHFWGMMSLATIVGGFIAYPINRWLVKRGLKHGMMTVRKGEEMHMHHGEVTATKKEVDRALIGSLIALAVGIAISIIGAYL